MRYRPKPGTLVIVTWDAHARKWLVTYGEKFWRTDQPFYVAQVTFDSQDNKPVAVGWVAESAQLASPVEVSFNEVLEPYMKVGDKLIRVPADSAHSCRFAVERDPFNNQRIPVVWSAWTSK